jgi:macrodomain Ter protein organizer (MatP/YcbG family)
MEPVANKRKLIDLRPDVFRGLSLKARKRGVTLKRYIENVLEEDAADTETSIPHGVTSPKIISLIGLAKGADMDWEEERLNYLLQK